MAKLDKIDGAVDYLTSGVVRELGKIDATVAELNAAITARLGKFDGAFENLCYSNNRLQERIQLLEMVCLQLQLT